MGHPLLTNRRDIQVTPAFWGDGRLDTIAWLIPPFSLPLSFVLVPLRCLGPIAPSAATVVHRWSAAKLLPMGAAKARAAEGRSAM